MPSGWVGVVCPVFECQLPEYFFPFFCCKCELLLRYCLASITRNNNNNHPKKRRAYVDDTQLKAKTRSKANKKLNPQKMNRGWEKSQGNPITNPKLQSARQKEKQQEIKRQCQEICIGSTLKYMVAKTATRPSTTLPAVSKSYHMPPANRLIITHGTLRMKDNSIFYSNSLISEPSS